VKFKNWFEENKARAEQYRSDLNANSMQFKKCAQEIRAIEIFADRHWEYLKGIYRNFSEANQILEARRVNLHNKFAQSQDWQYLQQQTAEILEVTNRRQQKT
jgi:hypothetical protein